MSSTAVYISADDDETGSKNPSRICGLTRRTVVVVSVCLCALIAAGLAIGLWLTRRSTTQGTDATGLRFVGFGDFGRRGSTQQLVTAAAMSR